MHYYLLLDPNVKQPLANVPSLRCRYCCHKKKKKKKKKKKMGMTCYINFFSFIIFGVHTMFKKYFFNIIPNFINILCKTCMNFSTFPSRSFPKIYIRFNICPFCCLCTSKRDYKVFIIP